jgi:tight adherence protein C
MNLLIFFIIAPLLLGGIWLITEATIDPFRGVRASAMAKNRRFLRDRFLLLTFSISVLFFLTIFYRDFILPAIFLFTSIYLYFEYSAKTFERERKRRIDVMERELPIFIQTITLLISSGLSPIQTFSILGKNSKSNTALYFRDVVGAVQGGKSITEALDGFASHTPSPIARRFKTSLILGIERGSPLTQIMIGQVRDARNMQKNQQLRAAGKAEISLMIPVVFLILPISVLFALWPSFQQLNGFAG